MKDLKSKLISEFDFRKADVSEVDFTYEMDKKFIEKEMLRIKKKNKVSYEAEEVNKGDIVLCSLKSDNPKYNREISLNTGLGLFKKEIESALIGMRKSESKTVSVDGENVSIEILNIERSELPDRLTDEMARKEEIEGVATVKELEDYLHKLYQEKVDSAINNKAYYLVEAVLKQVVPQSKYEIYEEDIQYLAELEIQKGRVLAENDGLILEKMTEEDFKGRVPVKSYEKFLEMVDKLSRNNLYVLLLGLKKAEEDGYEVSKEEYEEFLKEYYTMYKMDPQVARNAQSWELYETNGYVRYFRRQIINYYKERFQEV